MAKTIKALVASRLVVSKKELPRDIRDELYSKLTWDNPEYKDAQFRGMNTEGIPQFIRGIKYNPASHKYFLAREFAPEFDAICDAYGYKVDYDDKRVLFEGARKLSHSISPWRPQKRAIDEMLDDEYGHQGILDAPCGSGKTIIGLYIAAELGQPTLVLAHTNDLIKQWQQYCKKFLDYEPGLIQGNTVVEKQITIASVMTLAQRKLSKEFLNKWGCVILDEAHHCPAVSFKDVLTRFPAYYRFGLTATPQRNDNLEGLLFTICGPVIAQITHEELRQAGLIVKPIVRVLETGWTYPYMGMRTWHRMVKALVHDAARNELIVNNIIEEHRSGKHTQLVLSKHIDHLLLLQALLKAKDPSIASKLLIAGGVKKDRRGNVLRNVGLSTKERQEIIEEARSGTVRVLFGTQLADEGLDIPRLDRLHLTFPTRAEGKIEQQVGRIQRVHKGKKDAYVYDYVDDVKLLRDQFSDRRNVYTGMGLEVQRDYV